MMNQGKSMPITKKASDKLVPPATAKAVAAETIKKLKATTKAAAANAPCSPCFAKSNQPS
jgi:glutamate dehydrogenase/leucine dehydrogenase